MIQSVSAEVSVTVWAECRQVDASDYTLQLARRKEINIESITKHAPMSIGQLPLASTTGGKSTVTDILQALQG